MKINSEALSKINNGLSYMNDKVSLIVVCRNEEKYIRSCLTSMIDNDYPNELKEIIVVDGMSSDRTREIVKEFQQKYDNITILDNPTTYTPQGLNIGIKASTGFYVFYIHAHTSYPKNYISLLLYWKKKLKCDNVGVLINTEVINKNKVSLAILKVLSHRLGVGNTVFRVGIKNDDPVEVDTAPFGCFERNLFYKIGYYDERLIRNQDLELNKRIQLYGGKIFLIPQLKCVYHARETYMELAKNNFFNGLWNILTLYYTKRLHSISFRHYIPLIFILSLVLPSLTGFFYFPFVFLSLFSLLSYHIVVMKISWNLCDKSTGFFYLLRAFYTLHFSYGIGSLSGIFYTLFRMLTDPFFNKRSIKHDK